MLKNIGPYNHNNLTKARIERPKASRMNLTSVEMETGTEGLHLHPHRTSLKVRLEQVHRDRAERRHSGGV